MRNLIFTLSLVLITFYSSGQFTDYNIDQKYFDKYNSIPDYFQGFKQSSLLNDYDVGFYFLDIQLERTSIYIAGNVSITAIVSASVLDTFAVELIQSLSVDSVFINNIKLSSIHTNDHIYVPLPVSMTEDSLFTAQIFYHGTPSTGGGFFSGITHDHSPSWGNDVTWTLSEPFNANQWWPCKQILTDKADSSWVFITTSSANMAGSNGILTATTSVPGSKLRYEWKNHYPIVYYLISASVAKYVDYTIYAHPTGTTDSVMIQNFVYDNPSTLPYFKNEIDFTDDFIEIYSDLFGIYPFIGDKYGHCMAPISGGMEHQTMTTLGYFTFYLTCHELAHQWFGNNVTCSSWSDIWINEGFASYSEYLAAENLISYSEAQSHMADVHTSVLSQSGGSVYVPPADLSDINRIFSGRLSYDKGSAIIHMIRFELQNDSIFFLTLRNFMNAFKDSTASGLDFKGVLESTSSKDFTDFFNQWYFGEGYPYYDLIWCQYSDTLHITALQTSSSMVTPLFKMLMEYKISYSGGDTLIYLNQTSSYNDFKIPISKTVTNITVDPNNWVLNGPSSVTMNIKKDKDELFFTVFPNPCIDYININLQKNNSMNITYCIYNYAGIQVEKGIINRFSNTISTKGLNSGLYIINISDGESQYNSRFIKN